MRTSGISPKVIASAITGLIVFALTKLAISVDPIVEQAINVLAMVAAGYIAPPGDVAEPEIGPPSDHELAADVEQRLRNEDGQGVVEVCVVLTLVGVCLLLAGVRF